MVRCVTFRSRRARIVVETWIDALSVCTLFIRWTIAVATTTNHMTNCEWITSITAETSAFGSSLIHVAFSIDAARIVDQTRIDTIGVNTCLAGVTFGIRSTSNGATTNIRIAFIACLARTDGSMIFNRARSVWATVAWVAT